MVNRIALSIITFSIILSSFYSKPLLKDDEYEYDELDEIETKYFLQASTFSSPLSSENFTFSSQTSSQPNETSAPSNETSSQPNETSAPFNKTSSSSNETSTPFNQNSFTGWSWSFLGGLAGGVVAVVAVLSMIVAYLYKQYNYKAKAPLPFEPPTPTKTFPFEHDFSVSSITDTDSQGLPESEGLSSQSESFQSEMDALQQNLLPHESESFQSQPNALQSNLLPHESESFQSRPESLHNQPRDLQSQPGLNAIILHRPNLRSNPAQTAFYGQTVQHNGSQRKRWRR
jgi:hypothetical protein